MVKPMKRFLTFLVLLLSGLTAMADAPLRRAISPTQPVWLVHIDNWNDADPKKIISLIPDDIKPYVVFNVSMSISHDENTGAFNRVPDGYSTARSWVRACAEQGVWCMVQCSSGGFSHFPENDLRFYEELYHDYPNFIGWNYAEQFWGFDDPFSCSFDERLAHFADLMRLARKYGGYLCVSFCGNIWSQSLSPLAMMKRSSDFAREASEAPQNLIICDKYTMSSMFYNYESTNFGTFVAGYTTNYGIRFDQCGWSGELDSETNFPTAAGVAPVLNNWLLTGGTVNDGPELIWQQDFKTTGTKVLADGYTTRTFERFPQFDNISIDLYRKILDGMVRIPTRDEVLDRHRLVLIDDVDTGSDNLVYNVPETLYDGLYNMDDTKHMGDQTTWFKKTGRYPTIPVVASLVDEAARQIPHQIKRSTYDSRWKTIAQKKAEFDAIFPEEYQGDAFAGRVANRWLVYNPFKNGRSATAAIPLQYNTCEKLTLTLAQYSTCLVKELADSIVVYMNNYRTDIATLKNDTLVVDGAAMRPTLHLADRGRHAVSRVVSTTWNDGRFTAVIAHNGPLDVVLACSGASADRKAVPADRLPVPPAAPAVWTGPVTHQCEDFDYRGTQGYKLAPRALASVTGFHGLGYHDFGTSSQALVRDSFTLARDAKYTITLRYSAPQGRPRVRIFVNGSPRMVSLPATGANQWGEYTMTGVDMKQGGNQIRIASYNNQNALYLDEVTVQDAAYRPAPAIDVDRYEVGYTISEGGTSTDSLRLTAQSLTGPLTVTAEGPFQVSFDREGGYAGTVRLQPDTLGRIDQGIVYVKGIAGTQLGTQEGTVTFTADGCPEWTTTLTMRVVPRPQTLIYDFTADRATSSYTNPPAKDVATPAGSSAKAGVVSYEGNKALKIYDNSNRNGSGALDLTRFTSQSTDYSVMWKQRNQTTSEYKVGVLLRGGNVVGTSSQGYAQGFREGYVFIVNNTPRSSTTSFRIYKSNTSTQLSTLVNKASSFNPVQNDAVWYRASVSGWPLVTLLLEYSTDGEHWTTGASTTDAAGTFRQGATQLVWGLAAQRGQFLVDDVTFEGITYDQTATGIRDVRTDASATGVLYNLSGQRVRHMQPGHIYIRDGKKILAR